MIVSSHQMASVLWLSGRLAEDLRLSQESMRRASAWGGPEVVMACACESSAGAVASGDPASALRLLYTATGGLASPPVTRRSAMVALRFAQANRALGEIDAARECLDFALGLVQVLGDNVGQGYIQLELGRSGPRCWRPGTGRKPDSARPGLRWPPPTARPARPRHSAP
jgi:hypothetical protein